MQDDIINYLSAYEYKAVSQSGVRTFSWTKLLFEGVKILVSMESKSF